MVDERGCDRIAIFYGKDGEDFQLLALRIRTALRGKELIDAIKDGQVKEGVNQNSLSIIVPVLVDNPLMVVQKMYGISYINDTQDIR